MSRRLISECLPPWIPTSLPSWLFWHDNSLNQRHMKPATVATSMEIEWNNCGQIMSNPWALLTTGFGRLSFWPIATSEFQTRLRMHPQKKRDILRGLRSFHKAQNRKIRYLTLVSVNTHTQTIQHFPKIVQSCGLFWLHHQLHRSIHGKQPKVWTPSELLRLLSFGSVISDRAGASNIFETTNHIVAYFVWFPASL